MDHSKILNILDELIKDEYDPNIEKISEYIDLDPDLILVKESTSDPKKIEVPGIHKKKTSRKSKPKPDPKKSKEKKTVYSHDSLGNPIIKTKGKNQTEKGGQVLYSGILKLSEILEDNLTEADWASELNLTKKDKPRVPPKEIFRKQINQLPLEIPNPTGIKFMNYSKSLQNAGNIIRMMVSAIRKIQSAIPCELAKDLELIDDYIKLSESGQPTMIVAPRSVKLWGLDWSGAPKTKRYFQIIRNETFAIFLNNLYQKFDQHKDECMDQDCIEYDHHKFLMDYLCNTKDLLWNTFVKNIERRNEHLEELRRKARKTKSKTQKRYHKLSMAISNFIDQVKNYYGEDIRSSAAGNFENPQYYCNLVSKYGDLLNNPELYKELSVNCENPDIEYKPHPSLLPDNQ